MKQSFSRRRFSKLSSFTLIELLVVVAIIAILAAVLLSAGSMALKAAKRAKASNLANQIQTAALGYYTEYGVYPIVGGGTGVDVYYSSSDQSDWQNLAWCLCGNVSAYNGSTQSPTATNSRGIAFLSLRSSDVDANGIPLNPQYPTGAGTYYNIAMDGNYDGLLGNNNSITLTNFALSTMPPTTNSVGVAVWANCNTGSGTNNNFYVHTY